MVIFAVLTVFWLFLTNGTLYQSSKNTQNHWCTNHHRSTKTVPIVYQRCTNRQKQSKDSQNKKNDHWCTNRNRTTKTVPTVYQSSKTVKTQSKQHKMTIGVPVVTCLPRLYQPCTNSVPKTVKRLSKQQKWPLVYRSSQVYQDCTNSVPTVYQSSKKSKQQKMTIGVDYQSSHVYQDCTNRVPTVYQKQSKDSQNSKNDHWCTDRHRSNKTVPTV